MEKGYMVKRKPYEKPVLINLKDKQVGTGDCTGGSADEELCQSNGGYTLGACDSNGVDAGSGCFSGNVDVPPE